LLANNLIPDIPPALAVSCAVLGLLVAVTRSGWLSLFMAAATVTSVTILPVLSLVILPAWLLVTGKPEMLIKTQPAQAESSDRERPAA
jgi:hypothetical protein